MRMMVMMVMMIIIRMIIMVMIHINMAKGPLWFSASTCPTSNVELILFIHGQSP